MEHQIGVETLESIDARLNAGPGRRAETTRVTRQNRRSRALAFRAFAEDLSGPVAVCLGLAGLNHVDHRAHHHREGARADLAAGLISGGRTARCSRKDCVVACAIHRCGRELSRSCQIPSAAVPWLQGCSRGCTASNQWMPSSSSHPGKGISQGSAGSCSTRRATGRRAPVPGLLPETVEPAAAIAQADPRLISQAGAKSRPICSA